MDKEEWVSDEYQRRECDFEARMMQKSFETKRAVFDLGLEPFIVMTNRRIDDLRHAINELRDRLLQTEHQLIRLSIMTDPRPVDLDEIPPPVVKIFPEGATRKQMDEIEDNTT